MSKPMSKSQRRRRVAQLRTEAERLEHYEQRQAAQREPIAEPSTLHEHTESLADALGARITKTRAYSAGE